MTEHENCRHAGWAKYGLLAALVAGGAAGGLYLSGGWPGTSAAPAANANVPSPGEATKSQRFPLTSFDVKDQVEAPNLAVDAAGRVFVAWSSQTSESEKKLFLARSDDAGTLYQAPTAVSRSGIVKFPAKMNGKIITRDSRLVPHVAAAGDAVHLAWAEALPDLSGIRMVHAVSTDGGVTFGTPQCVHRSAAARPTFTALAVGADGLIACSWLDNRDKVQQPYAAVREPEQARFGEECLVHAGADGRGVCPCCPIAAVIAPDGTTYVAFRNIDDGCRDIVIGRKKRGQAGFEGPFAIVPPTWKFDGCPHDGAALALVGDMLHVVWMDARSGTQRCYYAHAKLADMKFVARELNPGAVGSQGNAKLVADSAGALHAVWEQSIGPEPEGGRQHRHGPPQLGNGGGRAIMYAQMVAGNGQFSSARAIAARPGAFQTRPAIAVGKQGDLFVAWNELDETGKAVVVTRLNAQGEQP